MVFSVVPSVMAAEAEAVVPGPGGFQAVRVIIALGVLLLGAQGGVIAWLLHSRRRRKKDWIEMNASVELYRALVATMEQGLALHEMIYDADGKAIDYRFVEMNASFETMTGLKREQLVGRRVMEVLPHTERYWIDTYAQVVASGAPAHFDNYSAELKRYYEGLAYRPIPNHFAVIITDVTRRKEEEAARRKMEIKMQKAQKLESLGVLAGGIAHDFNNILMVILGNMEMARDDLPPHSPALASLREIEIAVRRASTLCRQMLAYSGQDTIAFQRMNPRQLLEEMSQLLRSSISKKAIFRITADDDLPWIEGDPNQLRQVIMNLVTNASEALGDEGGDIHIQLSARWCDEAYLSHFAADPPLQSGPYLLLKVTDNGVGMDSVSLARIFEPFYTTKFAGRGLGMAAVQGIMRTHGGAVSVESQPGIGTTVSALLPSLEDVSVSEEDLAACGLASGTSGATILLVDDEQALLTLGTRMLKRLGYSVEVARNGQEALDLYRQQMARIDLILLDVSMPTLDGPETLVKLKELNPSVRVIMTSGYGEHNLAERFNQQYPQRTITKPFTLTDLSRVIATTLRPDPPTGEA